MKAKAIIDFTNISDANTLVKGMQVRSGMVSNLYYPKCAALVVDFTDALTAYANALEAAKYGTPSQRAEKNLLKGMLVNVMRDLCNAVNQETPGDYVKLQTTGFTIFDGIRNRRILQAIKSLSIVNTGTPGQVKITVKAGDNTDFTIIQIAMGDAMPPEDAWKTCNDKNRTCIVSGLTSGQRCWARATAIGSHKQVVFAVPVNTIVL